MTSIAITHSCVTQRGHTIPPTLYRSDTSQLPVFPGQRHGRGFPKHQDTSSAILGTGVDPDWMSTLEQGGWLLRMHVVGHSITSIDWSLDALHWPEPLLTEDFATHSSRVPDPSPARTVDTEHQVDHFAPDPAVLFLDSSGNRLRFSDMDETSDEELEAEGFPHFARLRETGA